MGNFSETRTIGVMNKTQLLEMYGGVDMPTFESWIQDIIPQIGWRKRKQLFPPKVIRQIIEHIGEPLTLKVVQ